MNKLYRCEVCETVVDVLDRCSPELTCCGRVMTPAANPLPRMGRHRHEPLVRREGDCLVVRVGHLSHPMSADHQISWIELITYDRATRCFLRPGQLPEVRFDLPDSQAVIRCHCTEHGLVESRQFDASLATDIFLPTAALQSQRQVSCVLNGQH